MARLVHLRHGDTSKTMQTTAEGRLSIQRLADLLHLQANTVELNGVALDFDATGYTTQPLPQELGEAETDPITVTGRPVPASIPAGEQQSGPPAQPGLAEISARVIAAEAMAWAAQEETAQLAMRLALQSQTSQSDLDIGKRYMREAAKSGELDAGTVLVGVDEEPRQRVQAALEAVLVEWAHKYPEKPKTLAAAVAAHAKLNHRANPTEPKDMQPVLMKLLEKMIGAVNGGNYTLGDTSNRSIIGIDGFVDCTLLYEDSYSSPYVVAFMEFKLDSKGIPTAVSQVVNCCRAIFNQQLQRGFIIALALTCQDVRLVRVTEHKPSRHVQVQITKPLSLSVMVGNQPQLSMDAKGVDMIARFLAATVEQHDYRAPVMPAPIEFSNQQGTRFKLTGFVQIRAAQSNSGEVYTAQSQQQQADSSSMEVDIAAETVVVKVLLKPKEPKLLEKISAAPAEDSQHLVRLEGSFAFPGDDRLSLVLKPYCELPGSDDGVAKLSRLGCDVAQAIENLFKLTIYHRDISKNNVGFYNGRGYLFDLSAGKDFGDDPAQRQSDTGQPIKLTGTPLYCAVAVLEGKPHSISTDLESLYYVLRSIAYGKLPGDTSFKQSFHVKGWAAARRGHFCQPQHFADDDQYAPLIRGLHQLFWPTMQVGHRTYTTYLHDSPTPEEVKVAEFQAVCKLHLAA